jgi:pyruvate/2-oxoglutarate dehydrogenase complex dihydrolipoamide acyltransferase (E2) component
VATGAILAAVVVVIVLIASGGGDDNNATVADTTPATTLAAPTPPAATTPSTPAVTTPSAAAPAAKPVVRSEKCDPIIGSGTANGGTTYVVTSSAKDGDPAACGEAHSVLLSALQGQGTTIGHWTCKTNPTGSTVATCTSTGRRSIQAASS